MLRSRIANIVLSTALLVLVALTVAAGMAGAFFILPFAIGAAALLLFYFALRYQGVRNELAPLNVRLSDRWADGQPLTRASKRELLNKVLRLEAELDRKDAEEKSQRAAADRATEQPHRPEDWEGPPPINPFP